MEKKQPKQKKLNLFQKTLATLKAIAEIISTRNWLHDMRFKTDIIKGFYIPKSGNGIMEEEEFTWPFDIEKLKRTVDQGFIESMVKKYCEDEITRFDWGAAFDIIFTTYGQNVFETTDLREIEIAIAMSIISLKRTEQSR